MANGFLPVRKGESFDFTFDRSGESIDGWVCTIRVKTFASDTSLITARTIDPDGTEWPGFLTSTETAALAVGNYRLIGTLVNSSTDEEEQIMETTRFKVTASWAS